MKEVFVFALLAIAAAYVLHPLIMGKTDQGSDRSPSKVDIQDVQTEEKEAPRQQPKKKKPSSKKKNAKPTERHEYFDPESEDITQVGVLKRYLQWLQLNNVTFKNNTAGPYFAMADVHCRRSKFGALPHVSRGSQLSEWDEARDGPCHSPFLVSNVTGIIEENGLVASLPHYLMFNDHTLNPPLREAIGFWIKEGGDALLKKLQSPHTRYWAIMMNLLFERYIAGKDSVWQPWMRWLAESVHEETHAFFMPESVKKCLSPQAAKTIPAFQEELDYLQDLTDDFCAAMKGWKDNRPEKTKERDVNVKALLSCNFTRGGTGKNPTMTRMQWAYIVSQRYAHSLFGNVFTVFPLLDMMPYKPRATVRPGMMQHVDVPTTEEERAKMVEQGKEPETTTKAFGGLDFITSSHALTESTAAPAGSPLVFSMRGLLLEASEALLTYGYYDEDHFAEGVPSWIDWAVDPDDESDRMNEMNCTTAWDSTRVMRDGSVGESMFMCAELNVLRGEGQKEHRAVHDFKSDEIAAGGSKFLLSHLDLAQGSIPKREDRSECWDFERTSKTHPMLREVALHNEKLFGIFENMREKIHQRTEHRDFIRNKLFEAEKRHEEKIKQAEEMEKLGNTEPPV